MDYLSKVSRFMFLVFVASLLSCGGGPFENPNYLARNGLGPELRSVSVTVTNASGTVEVILAGQTLTFEGDGTQSVGGFELDAVITASLGATPEGQTCLFTPSNLTEITVGTSVNVDCGSPRLTGVVKNFFSDEFIVGASISVSRSVDGTNSSFPGASSNSEGVFTVNDVVLGDRYVVTIEASGYAPFSFTGLPAETRPVLRENIFLVPINGTATGDPSGAMSFTVDGVTVLEVPGDGLVTVAGDPPTGNVSAAITFFDPGSDPRSVSGRYEQNVAGAVGNIESYGALSIVLTDENSSELRLADGVSASLSVPIAGSAALLAPASSSAFVFNEDSGYWESPVAAVSALQGETAVYEATITSLSDTFIIGDEYTSATVQGCIEDSRGNRIAGATMVTQGRDYIGLAYGVSDDNGDFTVRARQDSSILVYGLVGSQSNTAQVNTTSGTTVLADCIILDQSSTTITLTWGEDPSDLDSQLFGPQPETTNRFRLYYGISLGPDVVVVNGVSLSLDVDDTSGFGPEVTTIPGFPLSGTYEFFVDHFRGELSSGESTILNSPARVEVNAQGEVFAFEPPSGPATFCWHVFNIEVDSALEGTVVPVGEWATNAACENGLNGATTTSANVYGEVQKPQYLSPASRAVMRKYYAN